MVPSSFHVVLPALAPSFQPWTTLMNTWHQSLKISSTLRPSMLLLLLESKHSTVIMTKLTTLKFIGLPWVSGHLVLYFSLFKSLFYLAVLHPHHKLHYCYDFRRLRQSSTIVVSKVQSQMSLEECKSWTCIVLLGLRAKVQVKGLSIKD